MIPEERARNIVHALIDPSDRLIPDDYHFVVGQLRAAINDTLDEVAAEVEKLERGTYTTAVSAAELVRRMKVKP
jgi:hypothetical protein